MSSVPNELKIIINTNIPGYQNIKYKPSMTFPNIKNLDDNIQFNPLIKLNSSVIKSLPQEIQVRELLDKGLFQSLINAHGLTKQKNLEEATYNGYVDNNISVTLEVLFPPNSVLYIDKEPYVIADLQWTKGDWKINQKIEDLPELDIKAIKNPYLYKSVIKDEIISGESELNNLPTNVIYGANYTGPMVVGKGINPPAQAPAPAPESTPASKPQPKSKTALPLPAPVERPPRGPGSIPSKPPRPREDDSFKPPLPSSVPKTKPYKNIPDYPALPPSEPPQKPYKKPYNYPALPPSSSSPTPKQILSPTGPEPLPLPPIEYTNETNLETSKESTVKLRQFFNNNNYYYLLNTFFKNMDSREKTAISKILAQTTTVNVKSMNNISVKAYKEIVNNIRVIKNKGGGDCFFIAVADGINYYNSNDSNNNKITYNNYGSENMLFTQQVLRQLVSNFILNLNTKTFNEMMVSLQYNVDYLNEEFKKQKNTISDKNNITDIINDIYYSNDNFLIQKPTSMTEETLKAPFKLVDKSDVKKYIESSDYWANYISMDALCSILKLNVIVLEVVGNNIRIPYVSYFPYSRYMFLYHKNNHYELITFDYKIKTIRREPNLEIKTQNIRRAIFDNNDNLYPPMNVILLIFGSNYIKIKEDEDRKKYALLTNIMKILEHIYYQIISDNNPDNKKFAQLFNNYFKNNTGNVITGGNTKNTKNTKLSYVIAIELYLKKGTSLTQEELSDLKCNHQWNSIRRSYANMRGLNYGMIPDYKNIQSLSNKTKKNYNPSKKNITYKR
jgi:hypothetical protein